MCGGARRSGPLWAALPRKAAWAPISGAYGFFSFFIVCMVFVSMRRRNVPEAISHACSIEVVSTTRRHEHCAEENDMPVIAGFDQLASVPEEQITDKIRRRVVSGQQGTMVYWKIKAGAHAGAHKHPHEQFVWMVSGTMEFRIGNEKRTMKPGDVAVIPGGVEHEGYFPEDSEAIDFFAPVREDFLTGSPPSYMTQR
jgi:unsaturated pyranuronate lyase